MGLPTQTCPCGQLSAAKKPVVLGACCGRYLYSSGSTPAPDAPSLMRSRYSAFVLGLSDYLVATWHTTTRPDDLTLDLGARWLGLEVRRHAVIDASHAEVEFVARYRPADGSGPATRIHERSRFVREDKRWYYVDGDLL